MTDRKSRRVVIINNINSETIDQAIFILKSEKGDKLQKKNDISIAQEAQNIINNYIRQVERIKSTSSHTFPKKKRLNTRTLVSTIVALFCLVSAFLIALFCKSSGFIDGLLRF